MPRPKGTGETFEQRKERYRSYDYRNVRLNRKDIKIITSCMDITPASDSITRMARALIHKGAKYLELEHRILSDPESIAKALSSNCAN